MTGRTAGAARRRRGSAPPASSTPRERPGEFRLLVSLLLLQIASGITELVFRPAHAPAPLAGLLAALVSTTAAGIAAEALWNLRPWATHAAAAAAVAAYLNAVGATVERIGMRLDGLAGLLLLALVLGLMVLYVHTEMRALSASRTPRTRRPQRR